MVNQEFCLHCVCVFALCVTVLVEHLQQGMDSDIEAKTQIVKHRHVDAEMTIHLSGKTSEVGNLGWILAA